MLRGCRFNFVRPLLASLLAFLVFVNTAFAERVKDLASVGGVRTNQLIGYGLVVGLDGTGDQTSQAPFTTQSLKNMLGRFGVALPPGVNAQTKNIAAVIVHADLPPFAKRGQTIDISVSSVGNAGSLRGGALLLTPLRGADGETYAMAQGSLVVGGFGVSGRDGSRIAVNVPSAGRIPGGATVEREVSSDFAASPWISLDLRTPDFTTALRLADGINRRLGTGVAEPLDAVSVRVTAPRDLTQRIAWLSTLEQLEVEPAEAPARVIVNSRTGTVVMNAKVRVLPAAIAHGSMSVTITERTDVSQPMALSNGTTVQIQRSEIDLKTPDARMFKFDAGVTLDTIVDAVNRVGAAPGDLVAILEALKQAGALRAELIIL